MLRISACSQSATARWLRHGLLMLMLPVLSACGDSTSARGEVEETIAYMKAHYLWADELPAQIQAGDYASGNEVLEALRVEPDRYSNVTDATAYNNFFNGLAVGFGFNYQFDNDNIRVFGVQRNAPANAAGLLRGDLITAINGKAVAQWVAENALDEAFGPSEVGLERTFSITRGQDPVSLSITKGAYELSYVLADNVFDVGGRKVGYINFYSFADPGVEPWRGALDRLIAQGAQDLIVDLRFNGGGLISVSGQIGSALGNSSLENREMTTLKFNTQQSTRNRTYRFIDDSRSGHFENLVWLTSRGTCSASESMILGLQAWRSATRIGEATCGKPVGFTPPTINDKVFSIVTFRLENPNGETDYFDGLAPDCPVTDTGIGQLGQADEVLTAAALSFLQTGSCPAAAGNQTVLKQQTAAPNMPAYSFDRLTNNLR